MDATTAVDQTLTCNIGDVTQAVDVTWKNNADGDVTSGAGGYTITKGTVDENYIQASTLTITAATLGGLADTSSPLTWKCAAKSTLYPNSVKSVYSNVVVTFLTFGKFLESVGWSNADAYNLSDFRTTTTTTTTTVQLINLEIMSTVNY